MATSINSINSNAQNKNKLQQFKPEEEKKTFFEGIHGTKEERQGNVKRQGRNYN